MTLFRSDYNQILQQTEVAMDDIRTDPELLKRSGLQFVINDPAWQKTLSTPTHTDCSGDLIEKLGMRLRKALGDEPVMDRNGYRNAPFGVPYYHSYVEGLEDTLWTVICARNPGGYRGSSFHIVDYSECYDAWDKTEYRNGFMCSLLSPYEYCYTYWDQKMNGNPPMKYYVPDLFDDATFGVWLGVLPQPVSIVFEGRVARLSWAATEPRVRRSNEMGRYTLPDDERTVEAKGINWRHARALALVNAFEKMAANEPADRYKSKMLAEQVARDKARS
jgi:hypothetical protein